MGRAANTNGKRANLHIEIDWEVFDALCQYRANLRSAHQQCITLREIVEAQLRHMLCPSPMSVEVVSAVSEELALREQNGETISRLMLYEEALRHHLGMPPMLWARGEAAS